MCNSNQIKMITHSSKLVFAAWIFLIASFTTSCASALVLDDWDEFDPHDSNSLMDQLTTADVIEAKLIVSLDSIESHRKSNDYFPARIEFDNVMGGVIKYDIKVKTRGKFRRRTCDMPPLKLDFSKKDLEAAGLLPFDDLKLVTHCLEDAAYSDKLVLKEYLAYKMYNLVTPYSYRVQLLRLTYQDANDPDRKLKRWAFVLESDDELAARIGGVECKNCMGQPEDRFDPIHERMVAMFEYMICNTDWSIKMNRNVKFFELPDHRLIPVPYDFDFSGFVKAPYAKSNQDVGQKGVDHRVFMGFAEDAREMYGTLALFKTKQPEFNRTILNFRHLPEADKMELVQYLDTFYQSINSLEEAQRALFN
ncbi:MAG: hypothetical protein CMN32_15790 [Saprospirales bacterium]|nr:hypothetical protein [Saprospirales bacterium]